MDARGATVNYTYDNRGLTTQVSTTSPNTAVIPETPTVTYSYDNLGNRTSMTDGLGTQTYEYNQLSQLTAETRIFSSSLTDVPQSANGFTHTYNYHLGGGLKTITYPNQVTLNYGLDKAGKLRSIDGASENQAISVLSNVDYRAWGSPKAITFGNGNVAEMTYNNKLSPDTEKYTGKKGDYYNGYYTATTVDNKYNYYADGSLRLIEDNTDTSTFHYKYRSQKYDQVGRLVAERSGNEALGTANLGAFTKYGYNFGYNEFGNLTSQQDTTGYNSLGGAGQTIGGSTELYAYTNNRIVGRGITPNGQGVTFASVPYDSEGRLLYLDGFNSTFDQAGQLTKQTKGTAVIQDFWYDGNGNQAKTKEVSNATEDTENFTNTTTRYVVYSSVLGEAIEYQSNVDSRYPTITNHQTKTHFYGFGGEIAWQVVSDIANGVQKTIELRYKTSFEAQRLNSEISGATSNGLISKQEAISSRGLEFLKIKPQPTTERGSFTGNTSFDSDFNEWLDGEGCALDGVIMPCSMTRRAFKSGAAMPSFLEKYQKYKGFRYEETGLGIYQWEYYVPGNNENKPLPPIEQETKGHYETGTLYYGWQRTWRTGSWERGQQADDPKLDPNYPREQLKDFWKRNPHCLEVINQLKDDAGKIIRGYQGAMTFVPIYNAAIPSGYSKPTTIFDDKNNKYKNAGDYFGKRGSRAATMWDEESIPTIWISLGAINDPSERVGRTTFHESLHAFFELAFGNGDHTFILDKLGIVNNFVKPNGFDNLTKKEQDAIIDFQASEDINKWIRNKCQNVSNKTTK